MSELSCQEVASANFHFEGIFLPSDLAILPSDLAVFSDLAILPSDLAVLPSTWPFFPLTWPFFPSSLFLFFLTIFAFSVLRWERLKQKLRMCNLSDELHHYPSFSFRFFRFMRKTFYFHHLQFIYL